jgi:2-haloacid dehalogenase
MTGQIDRRGVLLAGAAGSLGLLSSASSASATTARSSAETMPKAPTAKAPPKAFAFDVFGTVVDWRSSIAATAAPVLARAGRADIDAFAFTDAWRARYIVGMRAFGQSGRGFVKLDVLHREMLDAVLAELSLGLGQADRQALVLGWHRLDPWPDSVEGLTRLKQRLPVVTCSNGHVALMVNMARHAGLPWDAILGAEIARAYKPAPVVYTATAEALDLAPHDLCLVAAHHGDLAAARAAGLQCAFIPRPLEYGGAPAPDLKYEQHWEYRATSLIDLAQQLGC